MTDKQIIIDGIDVSGCKFYKGYCRISALCDYSGHLCEVTSNCDYKQLKRKEEECEELKKDLTDLSKIIDCKNGTILTFKEQLETQLKRKKQECEYWQKELDKTHLLMLEKQNELIKEKEKNEKQKMRS